MIHVRFQRASEELAIARGYYVEARGEERLDAETALRLATCNELLALRELLDQIEQLEELEEA
jgi:hypothetical protein